MNVDQLGVDVLTLDGSKVYGPRGIGALYVRRNTPIEPIIFGGGQENGLRSGTENLPGIMGLAKALEIVGKERAKEAVRIRELKNYFMSELKKIRSDVIVNAGGDHDSSVPHILNVSIPGIDNEFLLFQLDAAGIACSTKSSCLRDDDESYVLKAMGADSNTSLRFSSGRWTKRFEIDRVLKVLKTLLSKKA